VIFLDANVWMYAAGARHRNKAASARLLEAVARGEIAATTSVEILQEILHRYRAIGRWQDGRTVYDLARRIVPGVIPITVQITDRARELLDVHERLMARDALHAATCEAIGAAYLCSYDADFDSITWLRRIEPPDALKLALAR
jgi:predicted nucleic acid-binding protein